MRPGWGVGCQGRLPVGGQLAEIQQPAYSEVGGGLCWPVGEGIPGGGTQEAKGLGERGEGEWERAWCLCGGWPSRFRTAEAPGDTGIYLLAAVASD